MRMSGRDLPSPGFPVCRVCANERDPATWAKELMDGFVAGRDQSQTARR
jgi:hypothetical protein